MLGLTEQKDVVKQQIKINEDLIARKDEVIAQYTRENKSTTKLYEEKKNLENKILKLLTKLKKCELNLTNVNEKYEDLFERVLIT